MKIYTKTGDKGSTSLFGGARVSKNHIRIEAYGTVDELNSYVGLIKDQDINEVIKKDLALIQHDLFTMGSMLATPKNNYESSSKKNQLNIPKINENSILYLENRIDEMNSTLPEMTHFILPGGHQTVSFCHIARCVCRRAERNCVTLHENEAITEDLLRYLNRLSDFLFVLARKLTHDLGAQEIKWIPEKIN